MVINIKEKIFSQWLKVQKIFYGKSCKHWGNSFILHATDVKWPVVVFSIAQMFQQCNFTIASNYYIILGRKSILQLQLLSLILMVVTKITLHRSHNILSFLSIELYIWFSFLSLAEIGDLQLFTENVMALHSTIQRCT